MKGNKRVLESLNIILANELVAINQYFLHAKLFANEGFSKLAAAIRADSIDEMKHADILCDRILFLEGVPNMQTLGKLNIGKDPIKRYKSDLKLEVEAISDLQKAIRVCEDVGDFGSRDILLGILQSEEEHVAWLEEQLELISSLGLENYLHKCGVA